MKTQTADRLVKIVISLEAVAVSALLIVNLWQLQQAEPVDNILQGPMVWLLGPIFVVSWLWLCWRAWGAYLSPEGIKVQWPFWALVAVQVSYFPIGTVIGFSLMLIKVKFRPRTI